MTHSASQPLGQPFPGAQPQVRVGNDTAAAERIPGERTGDTLPLQVRPDPTGSGWTVRLPVRAEAVTVTKEVVVYERAVVHRRTLREVQHLEATVRREQLRVETDGQAIVDGG